MSGRGSEAWWFQHWGKPCLRDRQPTAKVRIGGQTFTIDARATPAFEALDRVFRRHGITCNPPYPDGDSGTGNCRHIGNDPNRPWSSHAWWAALDRNWNTNPDGSRLKTDLPRAVIDEVHALRTVSGAHVIRWGGDWDRDPRTGHSYYDAMHFEVHATPAELATGIQDPNETNSTKEEHVGLTTDQAEALARIDRHAREARDALADLHPEILDELRQLARAGVDVGELAKKLAGPVAEQVAEILGDRFAHQFADLLAERLRT